VTNYHLRSSNPLLNRTELDLKIISFMKIYLIANGDSRLSANQNCWQAQKELEESITKVVSALGHELVRAHPYDEVEKHGFISSQRMGMDVLGSIEDQTAPIIIAESVWQYSHHIYPGLYTYKGPILTLANWSGEWPGLVGLLNLNGSLTKAGINYSTLWAEDFSDDAFKAKLQTWIDSGTLTHQTKHVQDYQLTSTSNEAVQLAEEIASDLIKNKAIMGVFDEGCMGMYNAIIPDHLLHPVGVFKERLSQSALLAEMQTVSDEDAEAVFNWIDATGFTFKFGEDPATELTKDQVLNQCKMYVAACRIADHFKCDTIGIQYQQGLKDMCCASDLVEGMLNNSERPPVFNPEGNEINPGKPILHFNEVDECAGLDAILIERVHRALGQPVENTLHDLRWADWDQSGTTDQYVWVFEISGAAPPAHHVGGYAGSCGERQPAMFFPQGGSSLKGIAKAGEIIWSRIYIENDTLKMDIGRASAIDLPKEETQRRWDETTSEWPIMHAVLHGVTRDEMMARHKSNHIQVVYANSADEADQCLQVKAALAHKLGIQVSLCGVTL